MIKVDFHELGTIKDGDLVFAVIIARHDSKWIFSRHRNRDTWEIPGGHRESESIEECASRELIEETGAQKFNLRKLFIYSVEKDGVAVDYGQVFFAEIESIDKLPNMEIEEIKSFDDLPENLTYPQIQPFLFEKALEIIN